MADILELHKKVSDVIKQCVSIPWTDILLLQELEGCVLNSGENTPSEVACDLPVFCGGKKFYKPTYAYLEFQKTIPNYSDDFGIQNMLAAWGLTNARTRDAYHEINPDNYFEIIKEYRQTLHLTDDELADVIDQCFAKFPRVIKYKEFMTKVEKQEASAVKDSDILKMASSLMENYGQDIGYWIYSISVQACMWISYHSVSNYCSPGDGIDKNAPLTKAQNNFMQHRKFILSKYGTDEAREKYKLKKWEEYVEHGG